MEREKQMATCEQARQLDMVAYLAGLGYKPVKIRKFDYWYLSPLRTEKTPSFKINQKLNRWYDHGIGKGGNLIDFAVMYHHCTVADFLKMLDGQVALQPPIYSLPAVSEQAKESPIKVLQASPIQSIALCRYLEQRSIPVELAREYCQEVRYELNQKDYVAIGFKNDAGGYELRNPYFKASSSPKDITTFCYGAKVVTVFEGFFDFLSYMALQKNQGPKPADYLVLNSVAFFQKALPRLENYQAINLYLDRDYAGKRVTDQALNISPKFQDKSGLYQPYKDLNEWLVHQNPVRKEQKKSFKHKLH